MGDACDLCPTQPAFGEYWGCPDGKANEADTARLKKHIEDETERPNCDVITTVVLNSPDKNLKAGAPSTLSVSLKNTTSRSITLTWDDGCHCGAMPDQGLTLIVYSGLPKADLKGTACKAANQKWQTSFATSGQCHPDPPMPSFTLKPGETKAFGQPMVLQPDGLGCRYGAFSKRDMPMKVTATLDVNGGRMCSKSIPAIVQ